MKKNKFLVWPGIILLVLAAAVGAFFLGLFFSVFSQKLADVLFALASILGALQGVGLLILLTQEIRRPDNGW